MRSAEYRRAQQMFSALHHRFDVIVAYHDTVARTEAAIFVLRHRCPAAIVELHAETPGVARRMPRIVFFGRIADRCAGDDTRARHRRAPIAFTELITDQAANDRAEHGAATAVAMANFDLIDIAHSAA